MLFSLQKTKQLMSLEQYSPWLNDPKIQNTQTDHFNNSVSSLTWISNSICWAGTQFGLISL